MNRLHCVFLLQLATVWTHGQAAQQSQPPSRPAQAETLVQDFYQQVVIHETFGLPKAEEWKAYLPYLSKTLRHEMEDAKSCAADYARQDAQRHKKVPEKSLFSLESGLFSGNPDPSQLGRPSFKVERAVPEQDGSFLVHVQLKTLWPPPTKPLVWEVAARVVWEERHPAVDEITYINGVGGSLSKLFPELGCKGPRWVEHGDHSF